MVLARLRRRYLLAMQLPLVASAAVVAGACVESASSPLVTVPVSDGDAGPLASGARDASDLVDANGKVAKVPHDPPEPSPPPYPHVESQQCAMDYATPSPPELPPPFDACPRRWNDGQFTAKGTRAKRANEPDACCYLRFHARPVIGRALRDTDAARVADVRPRRDWSRAIDLPSAARLSANERVAIARAWREDARAEHASVAAFARIALELMALGAPPELVEAAHRAALDEIEHARTVFAIASAYDGEPLGPGALAAPRLGERVSIAEVAREAVIDGAFGELAAAVEAREASEAAVDPELRAALARIADDEERHAELAYCTIAWAVREGGDEARRAVRAALASIAIADGDDAVAAPEHGCVGAAARKRIREAVLSAVVEPCVAAMLTGL